MATGSKQEDIIYEHKPEARLFVFQFKKVSVSHEKICIKFSHAVSYISALNL